MASKGYRLTAATGIHKGDREYQQDQVALISHPRVDGLRAGHRGRRHGRAQRRPQGLRPGDDDGQAAVRALFARPRRRRLRCSSRWCRRRTWSSSSPPISSEQEPHSTLAAFLINPAGDCHWVHAGDSRIYHFHGGQLVKRTMDHSYVQTLVDRGELTEEEANVHPQSNILMGCLGAEDDPPADLHFIRQLRPGDVAAGLQRRRLALLQPERTGLGAVLAVAARGHRVPDREGALPRPWRRRQPVAGDRQARAAGS